MIDKPILITKDDCQRCDFVKEKIGERLRELEIVNADDVEGKVYMSYYQIYGTMEQDDQIQFPFLITVDEDVIHGTIAIKNHFLKRSDA